MAFDISTFAGTVAPVSESDTEFARIPLSKIRRNPQNFYPLPDGTAYLELIESIDANGLLEPLSVVPDDAGGYRLISGHSRFSALLHLAENRPTDERWEEILCRVLPAMTEAQELTAVIESNRQRVKSDALKAQEAERLTAAYVARKKAGEDLPGKIRDRVAADMQLSATKLANLKVIKGGLKVPGHIRMWEADELPESAALVIARMDLDTQYRLLDWMIDKKLEYTEKNVKLFAGIWSFAQKKCPETAGLCPNAEAMYKAHYRGGELHCAGCCKQCQDKGYCKTVCPYVAKEPLAADPAGVKADPMLEYIRHDLVPTFCRRVREAREASGLSKKEFAESIGEYPATYSAWENNSLAGSSAIPRLAQKLGVSTDYLYGLSDEPHGAAAAASATPSQAAEPGWQPLRSHTWPRDGQLVILAYETVLGGRGYQIARCVGSYAEEYPFIDPGNGNLSVMDIDELDADLWMPLPEAPAAK